MDSYPPRPRTPTPYDQPGAEMDPRDENSPSAPPMVLAGDDKEGATAPPAYYMPDNYACPPPAYTPYDPSMVTSSIMPEPISESALPSGLARPPPPARSPLYGHRAHASDLRLQRKLAREDAKLREREREFEGNLRYLEKMRGSGMLKVWPLTHADEGVAEERAKLERARADLNRRMAAANGMLASTCGPIASPIGHRAAAHTASASSATAAHSELMAADARLRAKEAEFAENDYYFQKMRSKGITKYWPLRDAEPEHERVKSELERQRAELDAKLAAAAKSASYRRSA